MIFRKVQKRSLHVTRENLWQVKLSVSYFNPWYYLKKNRKGWGIEKVLLDTAPFSLKKTLKFIIKLLFYNIYKARMILALVVAYANTW